MNEEIKKWRSIKKELASRKIAFLELDSEDLCDYGNDTPHAITLNVDDDTMDDEDLVFALRKIGNSYIIQYGEDLLESDEDRDISAKEMVDFVEREIKKANESLNGNERHNIDLSADKDAKSIKEDINNTGKHYVIVHQHLSNAQRLQIERAGFHVYSLQAQSATWGLGSQLQHRAFGSGHVADVITDFRALPNNQRAFKPDFDVFIEEVGAVEDEDLFKPILDKVLGKAEANESLIYDERHNIKLSADKAAKVIKESVDWLIQQDMGCCTKELTPEVQLAVGWIDGYDPEDPNLIHSKEEPTCCICVGIVAADGDYMKTDLEWLTIPYVADGENEGDVFSELMEPLSPNDNYAKVFEYLAKEYEGILKEYDVHSDGKCFHKKGNADMEESIKPKKGKGRLTFREKCRAAQRGFKYSPDLDYLMYEDEDMVIASDEAHIPSWDVLDSGDYDLYGREVTEDDTYLEDDGTPILMSSMLYDGPWEKFTIRDGHVVGREPTDEQPA